MQEKTDRNAQIIEDKENGATYKELEAKYNISRNTMSRIVARYKLKNN